MPGGGGAHNAAPELTHHFLACPLAALGMLWRRGAWSMQRTHRVLNGSRAVLWRFGLQPSLNAHVTPLLDAEQVVASTLMSFCLTLVSTSWQLGDTDSPGHVTDTVVRLVTGRVYDCRCSIARLSWQIWQPFPAIGSTPGAPKRATATSSYSLSRFPLPSAGSSCRQGAPVAPTILTLRTP